MLLPSALECESARPTSYTVVSPPASPPPLSRVHGGACRSLQMLVAAATTDVTTNATTTSSFLPTPPPPAPPSYRPWVPSSTSSFKVVDATTQGSSLAARRRFANKKRKATDREGEEDDDDTSPEMQLRLQLPPPQHQQHLQQLQPSTPKRQCRLPPETAPLGLTRSDFLINDDVDHDNPPSQEDEDAEWSPQNDRILVDLVLEKLRLTKAEWHHCARSLGLPRRAVARRWKTLLDRGDVGFKPRPGMHPTCT
ncbi:hypothetical protein CP533_3264 [Ophiocordyceps camponoti-saundersi (nom. inval.)]|nr:hypothetical protein CP533_3264 [Ophiocordyceps camponoti-saundersi (nom. inval.)]